ncbi:alpha/beta fold hydrolase [Carnobacterium funditum]|uniref:alpha/beta fold hydrolase n=1 Tax=Carnobacterium funditum TaxID=2752 RepID=UPI000558644E|nr:alpha/beta fold hydrolase [Carnobacterium funditum]
MKRLCLLSFVAVLLSIIIIGCGSQKGTEPVKESQLTSEPKASKSSEETQSSTEVSDVHAEDQASIPTLFIHGYGGTDFSFNGMLSRFEAEDYGKRWLTITVQPDGSISEAGNWQDDSASPFIQVLFADNKNNEWNQADWIKSVLIYLKTTYQVNEVNLVGHSMGGVSSFRYLVAYGSEDSQPAVKDFVAIGAPFNDFVEGNENQPLEELNQNGPLVRSGRYSEFSAAIQQYPSSTKMLNIVGDVADGSNSDGTVSISSGLSIGYLMQSNNFNYHEEVITGEQVSHSQLHENAEVDKLIVDFLQLKK